MTITPLELAMERTFQDQPVIIKDSVIGYCHELNEEGKVYVKFQLESTYPGGWYNLEDLKPVLRGYSPSLQDQIQRRWDPVRARERLIQKQKWGE